MEIEELKKRPESWPYQWRQKQKHPWCQPSSSVLHCLLHSSRRTIFWDLTYICYQCTHTSLFSFFFTAHIPFSFSSSSSSGLPSSILACPSNASIFLLDSLSMFMPTVHCLFVLELPRGNYENVNGNYVTLWMTKRQTKFQDCKIWLICKYLPQIKLKYFALFLTL